MNSDKRAQWVAEYHLNNTYTDMEAGIEQVSATEYWSLNDINNEHPEAKITLTWGDNSGVVDGHEEDLLVCELNGTTWESRGNASWTGDWDGGTITSSDPSSFSERFFTLGSSTADNALPIELLSFTVEMEGSKALIEWSTASELNNDVFIIERSHDGYYFDEIATVNGAGNSNQVIDYYTYDYEPLEGISYYRLKQVDFDGQFSYSDIVALENFNTANKQAKMEIYPNPLRTGSLNIHLTGFEEDEQIRIVLNDAYGRQIFTQTVNTFWREHIYLEMDIKAKAPKGIYVISVVSEQNAINKKLIIE